MTQQLNDQSSDREIIITRLLAAPQDLVFEAFTDPKHVINWWGPNGFTNTFHGMEVKPGGDWNFIMHGPDGVDYPNKIIYEEVVKPERLVYQHSSGQDGDHGFHVTITFTQQGDKTLVIMRSLFATAAERDMVVKEVGAIEGGNQTFDRLEQQLAGMQSGNMDALVITRTFNAPRTLVFKAFTEADSLAQWWGPKGFAMNSLTLDLKPGGLFHYCMSGNGFEMWGKFVYQNIVEPSRVVFVSSFADKDGNTIRAPFSPVWPLEVYNILTLAEQNGKTTLTLRGWPLNATQEELNAYGQMHASMQQGFAGTFEQLDAFLAKENA